jgi:hypothetical protein
MTMNKTEPVKRPPWRPSKYNPDFCDQVVTFGAEGKSRTWIAAQLGVLPDTMNEWAKVHPDFSDALTYAKALEQAYWEDLGRQHITTTGFAQNCWSRNMAARFPKEWRERQQVEHDVSGALADLLGQIDGDGASLV